MGFDFRVPVLDEYPNANYLIETNPAFTNKQVWLSSDAMLAALSVDPDTVQKRMGDGFYEQRLINEQVAQLTGYRRLTNYTSDEQQYQALMNAGVTFALAHQLRPGIALTAEQVASLTSDIVWLETREVTVPGRNGEPATVQKVLVPQVYAVARAGDLATDGTLLSGNVVNLTTSRVAGLYVTGEAGTLLASVGRDVDLVGALLQSQGTTTVTAARNRNLATVTTSASMDATKDAVNARNFIDGVEAIKRGDTKAGWTMIGLSLVGGGVSAAALKQEVGMVQNAAAAQSPTPLTQAA